MARTHDGAVWIVETKGRKEIGSAKKNWHG